MTPAEWPLRFVPRRSPPFWKALAISVVALIGAVVARGVFLGFDSATGLSVTYLPAFIFATLYAGAAWGWVTLGVALLIGALTQSALPVGVALENLILLYALSGGLSVYVSATLRAALLRLDDARAAEARVRADLSTSEARLQLAQDAGKVGLWDWDLVTGEGHWSSVVYRNLGLDPSGSADTHAMIAAVHPDDRQAVRDMTQAARFEGRMDAIEYRVVHPDGSTHWILSRGEMVRNAAGELVRALGVNIDVTDRRMAFEQMRDSEARFRILADSAPLLMWISRTDGRREFANRAYVDFVGEAYEAALVFDWRKVLHPDDLDRILKEQVAGEGSRKLFTLEARYRRTDGGYSWIRSVSQPRTGPDGEFAGFIGIGYDIGDAKRAEEDLKRINDLLAERVRDALAERDQAEMALRRAQKLEVVGQLTGGVAHDFNNLLTAILGNLELIQRAAAAPDGGARIQRLSATAIKAVQRGAALTKSLLAFSRNQPLQPRAIDANALLEEFADLMRQAAGPAVDIRIDASAALPSCVADPAELEAALLNLVINARDAIVGSGGTGWVHIRTRVAVLDEVALVANPEARPGLFVAIAVADNGPGMTADVSDKAFEPFFTTKPIGQGTGLGLSQVFGFARQLGGHVALDSMPSEGTVITVYLPVADNLA